MWKVWWLKAVFGSHRRAFDSGFIVHTLLREETLLADERADPAPWRPVGVREPLKPSSGRRTGGRRCGPVQ